MRRLLTLTLCAVLAIAALTAAAAPVANLQVAREAPGWYHPGLSLIHI